ncbi:hypothetical protein [Streptomyces lydicus]|uniref:hypothetical protein n=1 Tax=Streptomyces lydicus TaxID=47763 RepID=UPI0036F7A7F4
MSSVGRHRASAPNRTTARRCTCSTTPTSCTDHGAGFKGAAAWSLPDLAVRLGLMAARADELGSDDEAVAHAAVAALRERMRRHDATVDDSPFWGAVFEEFEEL